MNQLWRGLTAAALKAVQTLALEHLGGVQLDFGRVRGAVVISDDDRETPLNMIQLPNNTFVMAGTQVL